MAILTDGHSTRFDFLSSPGTTLLFREEDVTPPGLDGGGENDTTNMRNETWRTRQPKKLKTLTNSTLNCQYDPAFYADLVDMLQVNQQIRVTFSDGSKVTFWGWLDSLVPGSAVEGETPTAAVTVIPSNQDNDGNEVGPLYEAA